MSGHAPVAANRRQGTLAVYLDDPAPAAPEPGASSPWAGMSGAAVWAADRIVSVAAEHHPSEGTGRAHRPAHRPGVRTAAAIRPRPARAMARARPSYALIEQLTALGTR